MLMERTKLNTSRFFPEVFQAVDAGDFVVHAYMNDGSIRAYDVKPLLEKGGVFEPLRDPGTFSSHLTVMNGTVAWDLTGKRDPNDCIDIDPLEIFACEAVMEEIP